MPNLKSASLIAGPLILYVASYLALMERQVWYACANPFMLHIPIPHYRLGGDYTKKFFTPAHWCDRKLRPKYWEDWLE
jgi:hypothetical protein